MTNSLYSALADEAGALSRASRQWLESTDTAIEAIDSHAHVFVRGLPLAPHRRHAPDYDATLDAYTDHLRTNGVSHAVLVQPSFLGTDNSFFLDVLQRYPQRFRGVAVIDPSIDDDELQRLAKHGVVGMRLNLIGLALPDLREAHWRNLFERVNALGWHVEIHRDAIDLPMVVTPLLEQGCTVVIDHFGRPDPACGANDPGFRYLLTTAATGRVWVKLSAAYRSVHGESGTALGQTLTAALLDSFGAARLVWGSDWPHTQHRGLVDYDGSRDALDRWIPDASLRTIVLRDSARMLFRFSDRHDRHMTQAPTLRTR
ncbi:amidohydrolase family protein [Caballeronia ptereochthonis]|uniref:Hydrolase n=1 Tax=Caballeronia ptereochthonis TaxID=1777144 RepID=A0A158BAU3_9BURK|nr:amidohydrolase family protein [Caballeronia ptereochthonis]SAK67030.1 hydrolase [Caballeronia ptereochthonis]